VAVTVESIDPLASSGSAERGSTAAARSRPESVIGRFDVPLSEAASVRAYLLAWHGMDQAGSGSNRAVSLEDAKDRPIRARQESAPPQAVESKRDEPQ